MRIPDGVFIAGSGVVVPPTRQPIGRALECGVLDHEQVASSDATDLPVAQSVTEREPMLIEATDRALAMAGIEAEHVGLVAYAWVVETASDWKSAPRAARLVGARRALAIGVRQMCNGGAVAAHIAIAQLLAEPAIGASLVLTADALGPDNMNRWHCRAGAAVGDGATALLLSPEGGRLAVRSIASSGHSGQEAELPDRNPYGAEGSTGGVSRVFGGRSLFHMRRCVQDAVQAALCDAGLDNDDRRVSVILLPRLESWLLRVLLQGLLPEQGVRHRLHLTAGTGHFFAGDLAANVDHLLREELLGHDEYALILNVGGGFTATCLVVQAPSAR